jgi:hypothetical protein
MRTPDAILQEVWQIKDTAYKDAQGNSQCFIDQLRLRSVELRRGLDLKELEVSAQSSDQLTASPQLPC